MFWLGEHAPACEAFRCVESIEYADVDLQTFTGETAAMLGRKKESAIALGH